MTISFGRGELLIAHPHLIDPNFRHSVVLLCDHDEEGSFGLTVNDPLPISLSEAFPESDDLSSSECRLYRGGPVGSDQLMVLHRCEEIPGAIPICDDVFLGGDPDLLKAYLCSGAGEDNEYRVYAGYSGWGKQQLQQEIDQGSWILCPARMHFVFHTAPEAVWADVLRSLGGQFTLLAADPNLN
ncbi:MAG: YqgE/AlgH family protein [Planctomycetota bacterium]